MRTIDEIKQAYRERATSEYAKVRTSMTGEDLATIFDYIKELEEKIQALGEWESVDNPPLTKKANERGFAFSEPLYVLTVQSGYYRSNGNTGSFFDDDVGYYLEAIGWKPLPKP